MTEAKKYLSVPVAAELSGMTPRAIYDVIRREKFRSKPRFLAGQNDTAFPRGNFSAGWSSKSIDFKRRWPSSKIPTKNWRAISMDERPSWVIAPPEGSDTQKKPTDSPLSDSMAAGGAGKFFLTLRKMINVALTALCLAGFGIICWHAALFFAAPEFSEATAKFKASGHEADGERLAELGKVCRNGSGTPLACELVYFHHLSGLEMAAVKQERGVEHE